jgi:hypothetical protein
MTLDEFLDLETAEGDKEAHQMNWVANTIIGQNPRLLRGDNIPGPVSMVCNGRYSPEPVLQNPLEWNSPDLRVAVEQKTIKATVEQVLTGHPWLDIEVGKHNYLHMRGVLLSGPFANKKPGDLVRAHIGSLPIDVALTKDHIDATTYFVISYALSV